jgi:hypothetical protein
MENGGRCSSLKEEALSTSETEEHSMLFKTKKDRELNFKTETERLSNYGRLSILTRSQLILPRDFIQTLACIAIDHSTLSQDFQ